MPLVLPGKYLKLLIWGDNFSIQQRKEGKVVENSRSGEGKEKEGIRKIFTDLNSPRKALVLWKTAEKRSYNLVRRMINERKEELRRLRK